MYHGKCINKEHGVHPVEMFAYSKIYMNVRFDWSYLPLLFTFIFSVDISSGSAQTIPTNCTWNIRDHDFFHIVFSNLTDNDGRFIIHSKNMFKPLLSAFIPWKYWKWNFQKKKKNNFVAWCSTLGTGNLSTKNIEDSKYLALSLLLHMISLGPHMSDKGSP